MEYDEIYFEGKTIEGYERSYRERGYIINKKHFELLIREKLPKNAKILDIGCAYGYFIEIATKHGFICYGIDISNVALKEAKRHGEVIKATAELLPFKSNSLDVVTLFDVIEHLESPFKALKEVHRVLKRGGILIITTPNVNSLQRYIKRNKFHAFCDKTHKYLFIKKTLEYLVSKAGFNVKRVETHFYSLPTKLSSLLSFTGLGATIWLVARKE